MPRPRKDGAAAPNKRKLSEVYIRRLRPKDRVFDVWDTHQRGLCLKVQPSGHMAWKCVYAFHGRPRWYHIGDARGIKLDQARNIANEVTYRVLLHGKDPAAERKAERSRGTFEELATRYVEEHAKKNNKSWRQADALVKKHLLPKWGKLPAAGILRSDVKIMMARIKARVVANQTLAAASAIFSWGIKQDIVTANPCRGIDRNKTSSRERVLTDGELPLFWKAFDDADLLAGTALRVILLTGQRPGEVSRMRREHVKDGWWEMPGDPVPSLRWQGTKNGKSHRVWLPASVQKLIDDVGDGDDSRTGFVFAGPRGGSVENLDGAMRAASSRLKVEKATPHDLRRTHGTMIASLSFGRDAMNRI